MAAMREAPAGIATLTEAHWPALMKLFWRAFLSSIHHAIASVDEAGDPHVTPLGTLVLREPAKAIFFERFTTGLATNLARNERVCVLAVDSGRLFWLRSLIAGRFSGPPAVRLYGTVGDRRPATEDEVRLWEARVWPAKWTRGYRGSGVT
jgi:uncharacterized protein